ncbi:MAG: flavin reductase family protein [Candidatus Omnitrophica bacterium]|nr:flavin reductase family protein [Candidatus Omnitrophota bacterium]MCM8826070.1 flavin reductase family protein [Candidatus Omnitrophota bacterium]
MKREVNKERISRLINCGMVILISCAYKDKRNITTCAWYMPVSRVPSGVGIALAKKHFSSELISKKQDFIINIPPWSLLDKVIACGSLTGWEVDKFKITALTGEKAHSLVSTPKISECIGHIECVVIDVKEIGDHFIFLGEAIYAEAEDNYFRDNFWDTSCVDLIFHLGGKYFFKSSPYIEFK